MISKARINFWIQNRLNVCFISRHGVGKTAIVKEAFARHFGTNWAYFSGSTMDPFIDLVGIPRENRDKDGNPFLEMVQPKRIRDGVSAIFIDEYNRSKERTRNATMELIQFRSINGKPIPGLQIVWIACNPENGEYQVEPVDPAQLDRFDVTYELPYMLNRTYFVEKFSESIATPAIEWWTALPQEVKYDVSPRRLDHALEVFLKVDGEHYISDLLPENAGPKKLAKALKAGSVVFKMKKYAEEDPEKLRDFFANDHNYYLCRQTLQYDPVLLSKCTPYISREKITAHFPSSTISPAAGTNLPLRDSFPTIAAPSASCAVEDIDAIILDLKKQPDNTNTRVQALDRIISLVHDTAYFTLEEVIKTLQSLDLIIMRSHASTLIRHGERSLVLSLNTLVQYMLEFQIRLKQNRNKTVLAPYHRSLYKLRDILRNNDMELANEFCVA